MVLIHGGVQREERRKEQEIFTQSKDALILVPTDAAGEGINLQRANLLINYDFTWNLNRLEQRFGRIHRIGQTEVCHIWNMVADKIREGNVFRPGGPDGQGKPGRICPLSRFQAGNRRRDRTACRCPRRRVAQAGSLFKGAGTVTVTKNEIITCLNQPEKVPALMSDLLIWWNREASAWSPVVSSAVVHHRFEEIHPFADGNGRTGRTRALWELYRRCFDTHHVFAVDEIYWEMRPRYYRALAALQQEKGDLTGWLKFCAEALHLALERVWMRIQRLSVEARGMKIVLRPRQERLLQLLRDHRELAPREIRELLGVSRQGAMDLLNPSLMWAWSSASAPAAPASTSSRGESDQARIPEEADRGRAPARRHQCCGRRREEDEPQPPLDAAPLVGATAPRGGAGGALCAARQRPRRQAGLRRLDARGSVQAPRPSGMRVAKSTSWTGCGPSGPSSRCACPRPGSTGARLFRIFRRGRKTKQVFRPREEWIPIMIPPRSKKTSIIGSGNGAN